MPRSSNAISSTMGKSKKQRKDELERTAEPQDAGHRIGHGLRRQRDHKVGALDQIGPRGFLRKVSPRYYETLPLSRTRLSSAKPITKRIAMATNPACWL